ncbi:hypothetical protein GCM10023088_16990 [Actinomadura verrucosospora]
MARWSAARAAAPCVPPQVDRAGVYVGITMIAAALIGLLAFGGMLALPSTRTTALARGCGCGGRHL